MRIGVYGGSFDPPHIGHRVLAADATESLELDRLIVVPAGIQPLKAGKTGGASPEQRLAMAKLAFAGLERVEVDESECSRAGLSFTVDTLEGISSRYPAAQIFLLLGRDSYESLGRWKNPERIRELATVALLERGAAPAQADDVMVAATRRINVSSSEIRGRRKAGKTIVGLVPEAVLKYIESNNLYAPTGVSQE